MPEQPDTAVVGGGSWGTALACHLARIGVKTVVWAREPEVVEGINRHRRNPLFLSDVTVPESLRATGDLEEAVNSAQVILSSVPTQFVNRIRWHDLRSTGTLRDPGTSSSSLGANSRLHSRAAKPSHPRPLPEGREIPRARPGR